MPALKPAYFWEAQVELEVKNLAFSLEAEDIGRGATKTRKFGASWLKDGKVMWNPAQRLAGWLHHQMPLARSTYKEQIRAVKVYPEDNERWIPIAQVSDLVGADAPPDGNYEMPKGLPYPFKQFITVSDAKGGTRVTTTYWLELKKPVTVKLRIISFARGITPAIIEEALSKFGSATGLGDKHAVGYGLFKLVKFQAKEERLQL